MAYSPKQKSDIRAYVLAEVEQELSQAEESDDYKYIFEKYHVSLDNLLEQPHIKKQKILVLGDLPGKKNSYINIAASLGIPQKSIDFIDYYQIKNYGLNKLANTRQYTDIICGPIPHRIEGSFHSTNPNPVTEIEKLRPEVNVIICTKKQQGFHLHFSPTSFKEALLKTEYYKKYGKKEK